MSNNTKLLNPIELINNIFIGPTPNSISDIKNKSFTHLITIKEGIFDLNNQINHLNINIPDLPNIKISSHFAKLFSFIHMAVKQPHYKVYFCATRTELAAVFSLVSMMNEFGYSDAFCLKLLSTRLPSVKLGSPYVKQLHLFQNDLSKSKVQVKQQFQDKQLSRYKKVLDSDNIKDIIESTRNSTTNNQSMTMPDDIYKESISKETMNKELNTKNQKMNNSYNFNNLNDSGITNISLLQQQTQTQSFNNSLPQNNNISVNNTLLGSQNIKHSISKNTTGKNTIPNAQSKSSKLKHKYEKEEVKDKTNNNISNDINHQDNLNKIETNEKFKKTTTKEMLKDKKLYLDLDKVDRDHLNGQNVKNLSFSVRNKDIVNDQLVQDVIDKTFVNLNGLDSIVKKSKKLDMQQFRENV